MIEAEDEATSTEINKKTARRLVLRQRPGYEPSFFLEAGGAAGRTNPTNWLTADWHEKPRSLGEGARNILPEAYRSLPKAEKQQVKAAAKWIFKRVSLLDWGRKMPDEKAGKPLPKPVNLKEQVVPFIQGNWGSRIRKLTLTAIIRHLVDDDTAYFTANSLGDETLLMIDVDCHATGTLEGATHFAEYLKRNYFPNLYIETSTHGNGAHGFLVVDKRFWTAAEYKGVLGDVEKWLKRVLRSTDFDVEDVELKGTPMTVEWGARRGQVQGSDLRLPGEDAPGLEADGGVGGDYSFDGARPRAAAGKVRRGGTG